MIAPWLSSPFWSTAVEFVQSLVLALSVSLDASTDAGTQPSAKPTSTCPVLSSVMSLKSSRLRQGLLPPEFQMQPRCTGSLGVASTVVQVLPRSYVVATYMCHSPPVKVWPSELLPNDAACVEPRVGVPRNAKAARLPSPAMTSENSVFLIPKGMPTSMDFVQVLPSSVLTAIFGLPVPSPYPK